MSNINPIEGSYIDKEENNEETIKQLLQEQKNAKQEEK